MLLLEFPKSKASDIGIGTGRGHTWEAENKDASRGKCSIVVCCSERILARINKGGHRPKAVCPGVSHCIGP